MPLFTLNDLAARTAAPPVTTSPPTVSTGQEHFVAGAKGDLLRELLPDPAPDTTYDMVSRGAWHKHQMLGHLLTFSGPAEVWLTSWGISTQPLQIILDLLRAQAITRLHFILDIRVKQQAPQAYQLLLAVHNEARVRVYLTRIHAKVLVIRSATRTFTVRTSANLTRNPRVESYCISTHAHIADAWASTLNDIARAASPFTA